MISTSTNGGYDIVHWNSIEPDGNSVIASFRHLDAVYKIRKSTGSIVWKLGGTTTPKSLTVEATRSLHFGGQHDARLLSDGTLTVFDNRTGLDDPKPRAVRYPIDQQAGTATLASVDQRSRRPGLVLLRLGPRPPDQDWLIDWGQASNADRRLHADGERTFLLTADAGFSYKAEPVPEEAVTASDLRKAMAQMGAASR